MGEGEKDHGIEIWEGGWGGNIIGVGGRLLILERDLILERNLEMFTKLLCAWVVCIYS